MAYADQRARLLTHAQTAGAAITPKILDVQAGFPVPKGDCVRLWYGGETDTQRMGGRYSLNSEMVAKVTMIGLFLDVTTLNEAQAALIDARAEAFSHAFRTAVDADSGLNGGADNTTLEYGEPELVIFGNTRFLAILWSAITDYVEYPLAK